MACEGFQRVCLDRIDREDQRYRISTATDPAALARAIDKVGLISPPILLARHGGGYLVVSGFRRLAALAQLGRDDLDARILSDRTPHLQCAMTAVADNSLQRRLNPMETARALALLASATEDNEALAEAASAMGVDAHPSRFRKFLALVRLPEPIQSALESEAVALEMALELGRLAPCESTVLADLFLRLRPSLGKQREILVLCREIAKREGTAIDALIAEEEIQAIVSDPSPDGNAKTAALRKTLKQRRFPNLVSAEIDFSARRKALRLPEGLDLTPPPSFEGRTYRIGLSFQSRDDLERHRDTLTRLLTEAPLKEILDRSS